jgi:hypothetical protein
MIQIGPSEDSRTPDPALGDSVGLVTAEEVGAALPVSSESADDDSQAAKLSGSTAAEHKNGHNGRQHNDLVWPTKSDGNTAASMFPIEHFIVAFLPILGYVSVRDRELPTPRLAALVFVGSQFPDLIDKPLAHQFGLLPSGRVGMHSLPIAVPFVCVVVAYGWHTDRLRLTSVFAFAHLSHLLADNYRPLLKPTPSVSPDLLWPFTQPVARSAVPGWAGVNGINVLLWTTFSVVVLAIFGYVVVADVREELWVATAGE